MRRGEICGLRWQDFDEKTGRLQIRRAVSNRKGSGVKVGETKTEKGMLDIVVVSPSDALDEIISTVKEICRQQSIIQKVARIQVTASELPKNKLGKIIRTRN